MDRDLRPNERLVDSWKDAVERASKGQDVLFLASAMLRLDEGFVDLKAQLAQAQRDASWAATHRSELTDLRDAFKKSEQALTETQRVNRQLAEALQGIQRMSAPGGRTLDDFMRDMGYINDRARAALAAAQAQDAPAEGETA